MTMKNLRSLLVAAGIAVVAFGCGDDFLEAQPTDFVTSERLGEIAAINPGILDGSLKGIYSTMYAAGSGGTTGHDDFGHKSNDIFADFLSGDLVLAGRVYGWYANFSDYLVTIDYTQLDNYQVWRFYYRIIFASNIVIESLGGNDAVPETDLGKWTMGQAKAMRAFGYFYLAQYLDEDYDPASPLLPIYLDTTVPNQALSSTEDVYDVIVSDLTDAVTLLDGFARSGKFEVNEDVARMLLAYTYAAMGEDALAAAQAQAVILNGNHSIKTSDTMTDGFNDLSDPSWVWGVDLTQDMGLGLISWWGQMDYFSYSYSAVGDHKSMNLELYNQIPADDARKGQFVNFGGNQYVHINKFYDAARVPFGASRTVTADIVYMRIEEAYLLHAETAYKSGDEPAARTSLRAVMDERVPDASYVDALTGQALLDEILLQSRIEFHAEGKNYLLKKRNGIDVVTGSNHLTKPSQVFGITSDELSFEIPQLEIQNNPNISLGDL